jgi:hypothetical protein
MTLNLKRPGENPFDSLDRAGCCMPVNHGRVWLSEFHQVDRSYGEWKSFTGVSILQLGGLKCLASKNLISKSCCSGLDMAQLIEINQF